MIQARIGADLFIAWRLRSEPTLPVGLEPVREGGGPWLLFACARLRRLRVLGVPAPGHRHVAAWLMPCQLGGGLIGNLFLSACSDDPLVVAAYRALGLRDATLARLRVESGRLAAPGLRAMVGGPLAVSDLAWFQRDRCGIINRSGVPHRLPLAKRGWRHAVRSVHITTGPADADPVGVLDCSDDLAHWGSPRPLVQSAPRTCDGLTP
jgi:hypothetical protein